MTITPEAYKEYQEEIWGSEYGKHTQLADQLAEKWSQDKDIKMFLLEGEISTPALREFLRGGDTLE